VRSFARSFRALIALLPLWALAAPGQPQSAAEDQRVTSLVLSSDRAHLESLLAEGLSASARGPEGRTVLMAVAGWLQPDPEAVRLLLARGASPSGVDDHGETALSMAACTGSAAVVRLLLEHGADPNAGQPLLSAVQCPGGIRPRREHAEVVHILIAHGAAVDGCDKAGRRALHFAAMKADLEPMRLLLLGGSDPNVIEDNTGNSPLHWASAVGAVDVVEFLLHSGAAVNLRNPYDCATALHRAAANGHLAVSRILIAHGADPGLTDHHGDTALGLAAGREQTAVASYLRTLAAQERGSPTAVCPLPDGLIKQACRAEQPSRPAAPSPALLTTAEVRARVRRLVTGWETQTGTLIAPEIRLAAEVEVAALLGSGCYSGAAEPERSHCRSVLGTDGGLLPPIQAFLDEALIGAAASTRPLFYRVGDTVTPDLIRRLGWPDEAVPNRIRCSELPAEFRASTAFFPEQESLHAVSPPVHRVCALPGSYSLALRDLTSGTTRVLKIDVGRHGPPRLSTLAQSDELGPVQVLPDASWFCAGPAPNAISPVTAALGRDAPPIRQDQRAAFSDATVAVVTLDDPAAACQRHCREALALRIIEAIELWRAGCSRCAFSTLGAIEVDGTVFVARPVIDLLVSAAPSQADQLLTRAPGDPSSVQLAGPVDFGTMSVAGELGHGGPLLPFLRISPGTPLAGELCHALDDLRSGPARSLRSVLCRTPEVTNCPGCVGLRLALSRGITLGCDEPTSTIACGAVDRGIELNVRNFRFVGLSWPSVGTAAPEQQSQGFGAGTDEVEILPVLVHEMGHWFGLPHLNTDPPSTPGPVNVMVPTFHPQGHCITPGNLRMANQAVDRGWHFRIVDCEGFRFVRAAGR
jgi:ankyrin repeat protein